MKARPNRSAQRIPVARTLKLSEAEIEDGDDKFKQWHWGIKPEKVVDWDDDDMPERLIECGRLIRLHIRPPRSANPKHPRRERDTMIEFSRAISTGAHVAYDPDHKFERLYLLIPDRAKTVLAERFWNENTAPAMDMNKLAMIAGGRHGPMRDYPSLSVKPVGILTAIVYRTHKAGDEEESDPRSYYIHSVGEITGCMPILATDETGRLWICGGNATSPTAGISD